MQLIRPLFKKSQLGTGAAADQAVADEIVASSAWSGAIRTLCVVFSLTVGWIVFFDPSLVGGLSFHNLVSFLSPR